MRSELHNRLKELDSRGEWERPKGFDYFRALGEVLHHQPYVERHLGTELSLDHSVQDASYFCALQNLDRSRLNPEGGGMVVPIITIRFSAFDRMFTIFGTQSECFTDHLPATIGYLNEQNYKYVTYEELATPYDGKAQPGTEGWTWFTRFFDYL